MKYKGINVQFGKEFKYKKSYVDEYMEAWWGNYFKGLIFFVTAPVFVFNYFKKKHKHSRK